MWRFLRRRILISCLSLCGVMVLVFFLSRLTGSPASLYLPIDATPEMIDQFNATHGFDQPLLVQFGDFVSGMVRLDFGMSIWLGEPAIAAVFRAFEITLILTMLALVFSLAVSTLLGCIAATLRFRLPDRVVTVYSLTVMSVPEFWFALVMVMVFAVRLDWVPTSGRESWMAWILPTLTLSLQPIGVFTQVIRGALADALGSGYIEAARARGLSATRRVLVHGLRNAALPVLTVMGERSRALISGSMIVGTVFGFGDVGFLIVSAVRHRDFAIIQAGVFVTGVGVLCITTLIDILYARADPRVKVA